MQSEPQPGPLDNAPPVAEAKSMLSRISKIEADLAELKADVAVIRSNYVTKEDLAREVNTLRVEMYKEFHKLTWRFIGATGALAGAVYFIARYVH